MTQVARNAAVLMATQNSGPCDGFCIVLATLFLGFFIFWFFWEVIKFKFF